MNLWSVLLACFICPQLPWVGAVTAVIFSSSQTCWFPIPVIPTWPTSLPSLSLPNFLHHHFPTAECQSHFYTTHHLDLIRVNGKRPFNFTWASWKLCSLQPYSLETYPYGITAFLYWRHLRLMAACLEIKLWLCCRSWTHLTWCCWALL